MDYSMLRQVAERYEAHRIQTEKARQTLVKAVRMAAADGMKQVEIVEAIGSTGHKREWVRKVVAGEPVDGTASYRLGRRPGGTP